jgi:hypothetical protein
MLSFSSILFFLYFVYRKALKHNIFVIISEILLLCFQETEKQLLKDQLERYKRFEEEAAEKARSQKEEAEAKEEDIKQLVREREGR